MFKGLRTTIYQVADIGAGKRWYEAAFGVTPYFDQPFYVGFNIGGYELGLQADSPAVSMTDNVIAYWGVDDADAAFAHLLAQGATPHHAVQDVGEGIRVASVRDPFGNVIGVIQNPHFGASHGVDA